MVHKYEIEVKRAAYPLLALLVASPGTNELVTAELSRSLAEMIKSCTPSLNPKFKLETTPDQMDLLACYALVDKALALELQSAVD
jgi:hypothetical protein